MVCKFCKIYYENDENGVFFNVEWVIRDVEDMMIVYVGISIDVLIAYLLKRYKRY
jgi:hypothetical protein